MDAMEAFDIKAQEKRCLALHRATKVRNSQLIRRRTEALLRAFQKWSCEFPLFQKCDELAKQLRERSYMLDSMRSSYLRDVVSIKYHLENIANYDITDGKEAETLTKMKEDMYALHAIPSIDLRSLVEKAKRSANQTSAQLLDSLVDSGLLDPETLSTLNPWEQSHGFRRILRIQRGPTYQPPIAGGESINLAVPSSKKLFVRICNDCIGVTTFVKEWNSEIEKCMQFKAQYHNIEALINEYRNLIAKLNVTIENQEAQIVQLLDKTGKLETANNWFAKWGAHIKSGGDEIDVFDLYKMFLNISEMAREDIAGHKMQLQNKMDTFVHIYHEREGHLKNALRAAELARDEDSRTRIALLAELRNCQQDLLSRGNQIEHMQRTNDSRQHENLLLDQKVARLEAMNKQCMSVIIAKEKEYAILRDESRDRIDSLKVTVDQMTNEATRTEEMLSETRDQLKDSKVKTLEYLYNIEK